MAIAWIVEIEDGVWLADIEGDPGRTLVRDNALEFETARLAADALQAALLLRSLPNAKIDRK